MRLPVRPAIAVFSASVPRLQEPLVLPFQFVVQDYSMDLAALALNPRGFHLVHAVDARVMRDFVRFHESCVELLRAASRVVSGLHPFRLLSPASS